MKHRWMFWHYMVMLLWAQWIVIGALWVAGLESLATLGMYSLLIHLATPFGVLYAYFADSRHLNEEQAAYQPSWGIWAVFSIIATPFVTSPVYLVRRHLALG